MYEVHERLFVGDEASCFRGARDNWAVVHACKSPCHQAAVGYRGSLPKGHPHYLVLEAGQHLYLNLIDPPIPLFMPESFTSFLDFAEGAWEDKSRLLIHCNQGESRAPTLAMLFMAKRLGALPAESFEVARNAFERIYPKYKPGSGIMQYVMSHWNQF